MSVLVNFDNVTKRFGDNVVLDSLSADFKKGETHIICGASGAGKSTIIRCINYLETINGGDIQFKGISVNKKVARKIRKKVTMVFQSFNLFPHLSILENALLGPVKSLGQSRKDVEGKVIEYLRRVGLEDKTNARPYQLSGGQQQRAAIVRALAMEPELILFDEPTSALDPEMIGEVLAVMKDLADEGRSMIVVTHEMGFAKEAADQISFMDEGKLAVTKPPADFFNDPEHEGARRFLSQIL